MVPIYEQIMDQIKSAMVNGVLKEADALPSVRSLSNELKISALTVKKAYDKLEEEGFVKTVHGKGTFILSTNKQITYETRVKMIEDEFEKVIDHAESIGLNKEEIREILSILLEE